jgi:hypothetical protein
MIAAHLAHDRTHLLERTIQATSEFTVGGADENCTARSGDTLPLIVTRDATAKVAAL